MMKERKKEVGVGGKKGVGGGGGGVCWRGQSGPNYRNAFVIVWSVYTGK